MPQLRRASASLWVAAILFASLLSPLSSSAAIPGPYAPSKPVYAPVILRAATHPALSTSSVPAAIAQPAIPAIPITITAKAAIVIEYPSGRVIYQRNAHERLPMASTTKIMTAIVALEYGKLDAEVVAYASDIVGGTTMGLRAGERQTMRSLLFGMMLPSGNDAATTLAHYLGAKLGAPAANSGAKGAISAFVSLMNASAVKLGLHDSHFANPHGLDAPQHYSSAYDLASMTWYAKHFDLFNEIVRQQTAQVPGHLLTNINKMLKRYVGAEGVKTGFTDDAGPCLVTSATRNGKTLITVVLNAPKLYDDSTALLDYGFAVLAVVPKAKAETLSIVASHPTIVQPVAAH